MNILLPQNLARFNSGKGQYFSHATTIEELAEEIQRENPLLYRALFDSNARPQPFVKFFNAGTDFFLERGFSSFVAPEERIEIISAISGG